jgi:hypothetical protein
MKKIVSIGAAAVLAGVSLAAGAWWGPYNAPYWGGYAPLYGPPVVAPYGYGLTQDQLKEMASQQQKAVEQLPKVGYAPFGYGPFAPWGGAPYFGRGGDFLNTPFMTPDVREMFRRSEVERAQALQESAARRAAFRARVEAQRAAMEARRAAWLANIGRYAPEAAVPAEVASEAEPVADEPAAPAAEPAKVEPAAAESATAQ